MASILLMTFTVIGLGLLVRFGQAEERISAGVFVAYMIAVPFAEPFQIAKWRAAIAILEIVLFLILWYFAERTRRWWFTAAAGFQLIAVITFVFPLLVRNNYVGTGVALRYGAWVLIVMAMIVGSWESWAHRRYRLLEQANGRNHPSP